MFRVLTLERRKSSAEREWEGYLAQLALLSQDRTFLCVRAVTWICCRTRGQFDAFTFLKRTEVSLIVGFQPRVSMYWPSPFSFFSHTESIFLLKRKFVFHVLEMSGSPEGWRVDLSQSNVSSSDAVGDPPAFLNDISQAVIKVLTPDSPYTVENWLPVERGGGEMEEMAPGMWMTFWLLKLRHCHCGQAPAFPCFLWESVRFLEAPWLNSLPLNSKLTLGFMGPCRTAPLVASEGSWDARILCRRYQDADLWTVNSHQYTEAGTQEWTHFGIWWWLTGGDLLSVWDLGSQASMRGANLELLSGQRCQLFPSFSAI